MHDSRCTGRTHKKPMNQSHNLLSVRYECKFQTNTTHSNLRLESDKKKGYLAACILLLLWKPLKRTCSQFLEVDVSEVSQTMTSEQTVWLWYVSTPAHAHAQAQVRAILNVFFFSLRGNIRARRVKFSTDIKLSYPASPLQRCPDNRKRSLNMHH